MTGLMLSKGREEGNGEEVERVEVYLQEDFTECRISYWRQEPCVCWSKTPSTREESMASHGARLCHDGGPFLFRIMSTFYTFQATTHCIPFSSVVSLLFALMRGTLDQPANQHIPFLCGWCSRYHWGPGLLELTAAENRGLSQRTLMEGGIWVVCLLPRTNFFLLIPDDR